MTPGSFSLPGDISSQFVSGLLLAFPLMEGDSRLSLTTRLESQTYVDMTMDTMKRFGIRISRSELEGKLCFSFLFRAAAYFGRSQRSARREKREGKAWVLGE